MPETNTSTNTKPIRVRPETRRKYERVAKARRWSFVEVADAAIDALIQSDKPRRQQSTSAA